MTHLRPGTREHAIAAGIIAAMTLVFFLPVLRGNSFSMVGAHMFAQYPWTGIVGPSPDVQGRGFAQTDHAEGLYPTSVFATNAVQSGQFPMWLPYSFSGIPIIETGSVGSGLLYPPKWLAMTMLSPIRQHDLILFTHLLLSGLGMYALLRYWSVNVLGALTGAIVWELNGHNGFFLTFEFVAVAAAWFPLVILGASLSVGRQSWRWALATGVAIGMSILHGIQHWEYIGTVVVVGWYGALATGPAYRLLGAGQRRAALFNLSLPALSGVTAAALSAPSWLSLLHLISHVHRQPLSLAAQLASGMPFSSFVRGLAFPHGQEALSFDFASLGFVGIPALMFACAGVGSARVLWRSPLAVLATVTGLIGSGMVLGLPVLVSVLRRVLPFFGALRLTDGYYLLCFAFAVLAGFGVSEVSRRLSRSIPVKRLILGVVLSLMAIEGGELVRFAWAINPTHPARREWLFPETPLITRLKSFQGEFHVLPVYLRDPSGQWTPPVLAGKVAAMFDLRSASGYESVLPLSTATLWRSVERGGTVAHDVPPAYRPYFFHDRLPARLLGNLSVGFIATPPGTEPRGSDGSNLIASGVLQLVYQGRDGWIYKLTGALPRAFLAPSVMAASDTETALKMLLAPEFNPQRAAILIGENAAAATGLPRIASSQSELTETATIVRDRLNEVSVAVRTVPPAMLVLNDSWDSGWRALVDGVEQPVLRVNYAFRGVVVPGGQHQVDFFYRPGFLVVGLLLSGATTAVLLSLCLSVGLRASFNRRSRSHSQDAG